MPRSLNEILRRAINEPENIHPWLAILDVVIPTDPPIPLFIVNNNENITFAGQEYTAYSFSIPLPTQTNGGQIPKTNLSVYDVDKSLRKYVDQLNGGAGTTVKLRLINTESLEAAVDYADLTLDFDLLEAYIEGDSVVLSLGGPNLMRQAFPPARYLVNCCQWATHYGGVECKLSAEARATYPTCEGTKDACELRGNSLNYGGYPGLVETALRIA